LNEVPDDLRYEKNHEWIRMTDNIAVVGITDFAQEELHEIVYVELTEINREIRKGDELAVIESVKARSEIYAPVSGKIININHTLIENDVPARPELINEDPYGSGWLVEIELSELGELQELLSPGEYAKFIEH